MWVSQNSTLIQEMPPKIITHCTVCVLWTSLRLNRFLVLSVTLFQLKMTEEIGLTSGLVPVRSHAGDTVLFATQLIFMRQSPPRRKIQTFCCVFISLRSLETMLIKTYLCLTEQQCIWYSLKKTMISVIWGAWAPDSSVLPCSLSCSVLIFFWDCS